MPRFGIVALDLASQLGWAHERGDGLPPFMGGVSLRGAGNNPGAKHCAYVDWLHPFLKIREPERVIYEAPWLTAGKASAATMEFLIGLAVVTDLICYRLDLPVSKASASTARKFFCGSGKAQKDDVGAECRRRGWAPQDDNVADACCLMDYAINLYTPSRYRRSYPGIR